MADLLVPADCSECGLPIEPGDRYRQLIGVQSEAFERSFGRMVAHADCAADCGAYWTLTTPENARAAAEASLSYVRKRHGDRFPLGARCTADGKPGRITGGAGKYVVVVLDGHKHGGNYHPRDLEVNQ